MAAPSLSVLFGNLSGPQREAVLSAFRCVELSAGSTFICKGEDMSGFSVVRRGRLNMFAPPLSANRAASWSPCVEVPDGMCWVHSALPGDFFGDSALLVPAQAQATIQASEDTSLWCLDRRAFRTIIVSLNTRETEDCESIVRQLPGLRISELNSSALAQLVSAMEPTRLPPFTRVCCYGDIPNKRMYIVREGSVAVTQRKPLPPAVPTNNTPSSSASTSTRPSLDSFRSSDGPFHAKADEDNIDRLRPSGEPLESVEVVSIYSKGEWFAKLDGGEQGEKGYVETMVEGREGGHRRWEESSGCGIATLSQRCLLLSFDIQAFERATGPFEQFLGEKQDL
eukprot:GHVS01096765.1.p1 GENE.GHVS01096765.1~~GHVS01096765.1.p1  ORF type:complete len:362 (-),score=55.67 GHVS01096765.1:305-1321(-)